MDLWRWPLMLLHPRTLLLVGGLSLAGLGHLLFVASPLPGNLAQAHSRIAGLTDSTSCATCHRAGGVNDGCLSCHTEIATQLNERSGYHHYLLADEPRQSCGDCHAEHNGHDFPLISDISWGAQTAAAFRHPHVDFGLHGKHDTLACEKCHTPDLKLVLPGFATLPRDETLLGLSQDCRACHADFHTDGLTPPCGACHGQDSFQPPVHFDHAVHFPLTGGHAKLSCDNCHRFPASTPVPAVASDHTLAVNVTPALSHPPAPSRLLPFPFDDVRGGTCGECHPTPHRVDFSEACEVCHSTHDPVWTNAATAMTPERHASTGFRLDPPHAEVACIGCHPADLVFKERHPDPRAPGYERRQDNCQGCHTDAHGGQFRGRHDGCLDCHDPHAFTPPIFGHAAHARLFALTGAHAAASCDACHKKESALAVRQFVGTPHECQVCHQDPHAGQFSVELASGDCNSCHDGTSTTFSIRPFDHQARTGFALTGAHAQADCVGCHREQSFEHAGSTVKARRYRDTATECQSCHKDVHRGQFADYDACTICHKSEWKWTDVVFNHNEQSRFPLEGAHRRVPCTGCHLSSETPDGDVVVHYKPLGRECKDCHAIPPNPVRDR
ncbi:MAG: hypothetical protein ACKVX7_14615 [Planctomycetota bacterium]